MSEQNSYETSESDSEISGKTQGPIENNLPKGKRIKCNTYRCRKCNPLSPKLTKEEIKIIQERNKNRTKPRQLKYCTNNCKICNIYIQKANYYIEQEILEYCIKQNEIKDNKQREQKESESQPEDKNEKYIKQTILDDNNLSIKDNFNLIKIRGDGNCLYRAILESLEINQKYHTTLRELAAKITEHRNWNIDQLTAYKVDSPKELADKIREPNSFSGEEAIISLAEYLKLTISIYMNDRGKTWIRLNAKQENEKIYLEFNQGKYADKDLEGHYNTLLPKVERATKAKEILNKYIAENETKQIEATNKKNHPNSNKNNINKIKILIWNTQGLNNYTKRLYLINLLYEEDIHIALLQETHLTNKEKMYIKGYKIFRSDGINHRKGVATLISTTLICDKYKIYEDDHGRFLKTKLKTPEGKETTISNIYTEPTMKEHIEIIPEAILNGDIIGGDLNKMDTSMKKDGVYQTNNIGKLTKRIEQPKGSSDHYILIYEKQLNINIDTEEKTISYLNNNIAESNWESIKEAMTQSKQLNLINPIIKKKIKPHQIQPDNQDYNEKYQEIKSRNEQRFKQQKEQDARELGMLIRNEQLGEKAYIKMATIMQTKNKNIFWKSEDDQTRQTVIQGFRTLYKDNKIILN